MLKPIILFIPVSSIEGVGEYTRSLILADEIKLHWPNADIHFVLNDKAPCFFTCPYSVHPCKNSATKDVEGVNTIIKHLKPDLVIFDASGRAKQFKQAKSIGAKIAFISQHNKKRNRGLKLNRLFNIDIHWVVQPDFCMTPLSWFQKVKLSLFQKTHPKNIGAIYSRQSTELQQKVLKKFNLKNDGYFVFNAGSGGHNASQFLSADIYFKAAKLFYEKTNISCVVVFGSNYPNAIPDSFDNGSDSQFVCLSSLNNDEFIALLINAKGRIISAGDTILQCIDLKKVSVAAAVSKDQPKRLAACVSQGVILESGLSIQSLYNQALNLLDDKITDELLHNMNAIHSLNALDVILDDFNHLLKRK